MNGEAAKDPAIPRVEQFNQLVRAFCVIVLIATFCVAFLWGIYRGTPVVSIEAFVGILTFAMTWWFKSRDDQQRRSDLAGATTTTTTTPPAGSAEPTRTVTAPAPPAGG